DPPARDIAAPRVEAQRGEEARGEGPQPPRRGARGRGNERSGLGLRRGRAARRDPFDRRSTSTRFTEASKAARSREPPARPRASARSALARPPTSVKKTRSL